MTESKLFRPKLVAQSWENFAETPSPNEASRDIAGVKNAAWSADGTCITATDVHNAIDTVIVPPHLLTTQDKPLVLSAYCTIPAAEPITSLCSYPRYQLQDLASALVLSSVREHPIRLHSALNAQLVASYPLINPLTEEYISPLSLCFTPDASQFVAGSDSLISTFDLARPGQDPITSVKTGPKSRKDNRWNPATSMRGIVSALAVDKASGMLAVGTFSSQIALYDANGSGVCAGSFSIQDNAANEGIGGAGITQLHWSPDGRYLYIAERKSDGVMVYDIRQTGQLLSWSEGRNARTNQRLGMELSESDNGSPEVWAGGTDGKVRMWSDMHLHEGVVKPSFEHKVHQGTVAFARTHSITDYLIAAVTSICVHPTGGVIVTSSAPTRPTKNVVEDEIDSKLKIWSI